MPPLAIHSASSVAFWRDDGQPTASLDAAARAFAQAVIAAATTSARRAHFMKIGKSPSHVALLPDGQAEY